MSACATPAISWASSITPMAKRYLIRILRSSYGILRNGGSSSGAGPYWLRCPAVYPSSFLALALERCAGSEVEDSMLIVGPRIEWECQSDRDWPKWRLPANPRSKGRLQMAERRLIQIESVAGVE